MTYFFPAYVAKDISWFLICKIAYTLYLINLYTDTSRKSLMLIQSRTSFIFRTYEPFILLAFFLSWADHRPYTRAV